MLPPERPDRIYVAFDDHRLVANAGLVLPVTLAHHLGLCELVDHHVDLGDAAGRANAGDKLDFTHFWNQSGLVQQAVPDVLGRHRLGAAPFVADLGGFLTVARRAWTLYKS